MSPRVKQSASRSNRSKTALTSAESTVPPPPYPPPLPIQLQQYIQPASSAVMTPSVNRASITQMLKTIERIRYSTELYLRIRTFMMVQKVRAIPIKIIARNIRQYATKIYKTTVAASQRTISNLKPRAQLIVSKLSHLRLPFTLPDIKQLQVITAKLWQPGKITGYMKSESLTFSRLCKTSGAGLFTISLLGMLFISPTIGSIAAIAAVMQFALGTILK